MGILNDYNSKKDFMVEWIDNKGKLHRVKVLNRFISANDAADFIYNTRITCAKYPKAWWI